jgi:hypothetical protein
MDPNLGPRTMDLGPWTSDHGPRALHLEPWCSGHFPPPIVRSLKIFTAFPSHNSTRMMTTTARTAVTGKVRGGERRGVRCPPPQFFLCLHASSISSSFCHLYPSLSISISLSLYLSLSLSISLHPPPSPSLSPSLSPCLSISLYLSPSVSPGLPVSLSLSRRDPPP